MHALILQHIACEPPGAFSEVMQERGWTTTTCEVDEVRGVPELGGIDAVVAMGGPMSVNDEAELPWLVDEKRLIRTAVTAGMPSAPWRFSTTIAWPHFSDSRSAITRADRSMPLPGGNGTMKRTVRCGQDCACTSGGAATSMASVTVVVIAATKRWSMDIPD